MKKYPISEVERQHQKYHKIYKLFSNSLYYHTIRSKYQVHFLPTVSSLYNCKVNLLQKYYTPYKLLL